MGKPIPLKPWHENYSLEQAIAEVYEQVKGCDKAVAIGESGLDYFRTSAQGKSAQQQAFRMHISLAKELNLPLQIHDREAHADTIRILMEEGAPERTVFHCFSGDKEMAQVLAEQGWYASIAGPVTYNANEWQRDAAPKDTSFAIAGGNRCALFNSASAPGAAECFLYACLDGAKAGRNHR